MRSLKRDSHVAGMRFVVGGIVLLAAWSALALRVELPLSVASTDGRVVAAVEPVEIASVMREPITAVAVRLGDWVEQGALLVQFDPVSQALELEISRERAAKLSREIESIKQELASSEAAGENEMVTYDRAMDHLSARIDESKARIQHAQTVEQLYSELRSERRIDALQYSQAKSNVAQNLSAIEGERAQLQEKEAAKQLARNRRASTQAHLERELAQLTGEAAELVPRLAQLERGVRELGIRAPFSGEVGAIANLAVGQTLDPGTWLMTLVPRRGYEFEAHFVAQEAAGRVKVGQPARVEFFALPWTQYGMINAHVTRVGSEERDGNVRVDLALDSDAELYSQIAHGLKGRATVLIEETTLARKLINLIGSTHVN